MKTIQKQKLSIVNRKSSIVNCTLSILLLFAAILFAGCTENTPGDDPDNPVNVVMQDLALQGTVKDESGNPLSGVKVTTGTLDTTTGSDGTFAFAQAGTVDDRAVVKFEKDGYFTLTRSGDKADEMYDEVMMYPKGNSDISLQTTFDASTAQTLQAGGVKIELPASCFVDAKGSAYSGTVHADILYLDANNPNMRKMMPGGDLATNQKGKMMIPVGTADVVFTDDAGNPLKIKAKTNVPVSYALPSGKSADGLPATVPLWSFDEGRGVWRQEGSATLKGNAYSGTATHFSPKSPGLDDEYSRILIEAVTCDDELVDRAVITVEPNYPGSLTPLVWDFWPSGEYYTRSGFCLIYVPVEVPVKVTGRYNGQTKTATLQTAKSGGMSNVHLEFKDNCNNGIDIIFNLKEGPTMQTFIVECVPAMPKPVSPLDRMDPLAFMKGSGIVSAKTGGDKDAWNDGVTIYPDKDRKGHWNADFTEFTYNCRQVYNWEELLWIGFVYLVTEPNPYYDLDFFKLYKIRSIKVLENKGVAITMPPGPYL